VDGNVKIKWDWNELTRQSVILNCEYTFGLHKFNHQPITTDTLVRSQTNPYGSCVVQCSTGTGVSPGTTIFHCQYDYTNAPKCGLSHTPYSLSNLERR
jgi:hypothetical protein